MTIANVDEEKLKLLMKSAIAEALRENRDLVRDIVEEAMEDVGLERAIAEGMASDPISREKVFEILDRVQ